METPNSTALREAERYADELLRKVRRAIASVWQRRLDADTEVSRVRLLAEEKSGELATKK